MNTLTRTSRRAPAVLAAALLLSWLPLHAQSRFDDLKPERRYDAEVVAAIQKGEARPLSKLALARTEPDTSGYDVLKYTIHCTPNFQSKTISARTRVDARVTTPGLESVDLDFVGFSISEVTVDGADASYTRTGGARMLRVQLPRQFNTGETFSIEVAYGGSPTIEDGLGFGFTRDGAATFAEPQGARLWYPCKDRPSDKAQYEGFITVPNGYVAASNGRLVDVGDDGAGTTYHWLESHQIATYLIDFAISDYHVIEDSLGDLPVNHYVYPEVETEARRDFSRTPEMIQNFQDRLGVAYPFDKYGHALFENFGGAMEHQSCTSYGAGLITGDNRYDRVVAHELGHQWFGDMVSPAEWEEIWLNEGFATWMEFLWTEHADPGFVSTLMASREQSYISYESQAGAFSLYAPPPSRLFATTIYQKGGWVVAMLRYVVGDEAFFAGLKAYLEGHAYGNATSQDLRAAMEAASGRDLSAFFDQWVYGVGYPIYDTAWTSRAVPGGHFQVDVRIEQSQTTPTVFTIPLEIEARGSNGQRTRQRVDVASGDTTVSLCLDFEPSSVVVDPDNRVLGTVRSASLGVAAQPPVCSDGQPDEIVIDDVAFTRSGKLEVTGVGFVVGDSIVEVNGEALAKTKYPKRHRNPDGTTAVLVGKQKHLKSLLPAGTPVQITVLNQSTGLRSAPVTFTRQ